MRGLRALVIGFAVMVLAGLGHAAPSFPAFTAPVVDQAGILDATTITILENRLKDYREKSGHQVAIATVPSLQGYDIRDFGYQLGRAWGVGDKAKNDGVLILVAPTEHKVSIETGYGVEGDLTDAMSSVIIQNAMVPRFKTGDWQGGLYAAVDDIQKVLGGQGDQVAKRVANQSAGLADYWPFIIFFVIVVLILMNASRGRRMIFLPGAGFGGGGFGGGGGGGFGGGGGGSFGGGGASGGW